MQNISQVAKMIGLTPKAIRYYEEKGLISEPHRSDSGYRKYNDTLISELQFLKKARLAGFNLKECTALIELYKDKNRCAKDVKSLTESKIEEMEVKAKALNDMIHYLKEINENCTGDDSSHCPIIDSLEQ
ncbi:Cu(I)-responsive transcriptional regulator [Vibrio sp.]|nr:Cu(I)-responsive transcriptional regulator [Vibrio sp.]